MYTIHMQNTRYTWHIHDYDIYENGPHILHREGAAQEILGTQYSMALTKDISAGYRVQLRFFPDVLKLHVAAVKFLV